MDDTDKKARQVVIKWAGTDKSDQPMENLILAVAAVLREAANLAAETTEFTGKQELDGARAEIAKLQADLLHSDSDCEQVRKELAEARDQSPERIRTLMAERYGARSACDILQAEIARLNQQADKLKAELEALQKHYDSDAAIYRQQAEQAAARQREKDIEIVDSEPEYPGDMPDEMFATIKNNRGLLTEAMRASVRLTKANIKRAILAQAEGKNK